MKKIEFKVRGVDRFIVTRYTEDGKAAGVEVAGEFDNENKAYRIAHALATAEGGVVVNDEPTERQVG